MEFHLINIHRSIQVWPTYFNTVYNVIRMFLSAIKYVIQYVNLWINDYLIITIFQTTITISDMKMVALLLRYNCFLFALWRINHQLNLFWLPCITIQYDEIHDFVNVSEKCELIFILNYAIVEEKNCVTVKDAKLKFLF